MSDQTLDPKILGEVISEYRKKKNMSMEVLSGFAVVGRAQIVQIERGLRTPSKATLRNICSALDVKMSVLTEEVERRMNENKSEQ